MADLEVLDRLRREHDARLRTVFDVLEREAVPRAESMQKSLLLTSIKRGREALDRGDWEPATFQIGVCLSISYYRGLLTLVRWHELRMMARYDEKAAVAAGAKIMPTKPYGLEEV